MARRLHELASAMVEKNRDLFSAVVAGMLYQLKNQGRPCQFVRKLLRIAQA